MPLWLQERLTFDKLFRISEPKRVYRSFTVRGPPLEIDSYQDVVYYIFNFKANPSTTGLRHRGYVKFFKPLHKNPKNVPLQHLECLVDCTCPDFRYRWAWADKQRQSSVVGAQSLNQAWNKAPRKPIPRERPVFVNTYWRRGSSSTGCWHPSPAVPRTRRISWIG